MYCSSICYPLVQCAAVKTHNPSMREPPQNHALSITKATCQGKLPLAATVPPMIIGLMPDDATPSFVPVGFESSFGARLAMSASVNVSGVSSTGRSLFFGLILSAFV